MRSPVLARCTVNQAPGHHSQRLSLHVLSATTLPAKPAKASFFPGAIPEAKAGNPEGLPAPTRRLWFGSTKATSALSLASIALGYHPECSERFHDWQPLPRKSLVRPFSLFAPRSHTSGRSQ